MPWLGPVELGEGRDGQCLLTGTVRFVRTPRPEDRRAHGYRYRRARDQFLRLDHLYPQRRPSLHDAHHCDMFCAFHTPASFSSHSQLAVPMSLSPQRPQFLSALPMVGCFRAISHKRPDESYKREKRQVKMDVKEKGIYGCFENVEGGVRGDFLDSAVWIHWISVMNSQRLTTDNEIGNSSQATRDAGRELHGCL